MIELKNEKNSYTSCFVCWSFMVIWPSCCRYMDNPQMVPWQYIFGRGLTIFHNPQFIFVF